MAEVEDKLGMTPVQWAQWQAYTQGFGEQDENGVDVSLIRQNLRLPFWTRLEKMERELAFFKEEDMDQNNDFQQAIEALNRSGFQFVIIGGIAMRLQGAAHMTDDIDFAFARDTQNLGLLVQALAPYHPRLRGAPTGLPFFWDVRTLQTSINLTLETDIGNIDLLGEPAGIASFDELWQRATVQSRNGIEVRVASVEDLIAMKRAAGRVKDKAHLLELERIQQISQTIRHLRYNSRTMCRILVVDDEEEVREAVQRRLSREGYTVETRRAKTRASRR